MLNPITLPPAKPSPEPTGHYRQLSSFCVFVQTDKKTGPDFLYCLGNFTMLVLTFMKSWSVLKGHIRKVCQCNN